MMGYFWYAEKYTLKAEDMNEENFHGQQNDLKSYLKVTVEMALKIREVINS